MHYRTLAVLALLIGITITGCSKNDPMENASTQFLTSIHDGKAEDAYKMTSPSLQKLTTEDQFKGFVSTLGLADYRSSRWFGHMQKDSAGYVEGEILRKDSVTVPVKLHMAQDHGTWKISGMERIPAFGLAGNISSQFPSDALVDQLVRGWVLELDKCVKANDFAEFYANMSSIGRQLTTPDILKQGFAPFVNGGIDIASAMKSKASVSPYMSGDVPGLPRILMIETSFQTSPKPLRLVMKFSSESGQWKLLSMNASL